MSELARFAVRGVIEGFYGTPWTHAERLDMIDFLSRHDYNTYFYSPKDDLYLREKWMEIHPDAAYREIDELIRATQQGGIRFVYCLSPGLSMEYSNRGHSDRLLHKYRSMFDRGVRYFGLLFDDIPMHLLHSEDVERYAHLAEAHVDVTMRVWEAVSQWSDEVKLVICPTQYNGLGKEPYIQHLGLHLPVEIDLFWTGRFVCSPFLTDGDAQRFQKYTQHKPLYWDNYPVNDLAMANELHIGPLRHRDPELWSHSAGYVANAMSRPECSKIPLITTAAYLRDPHGYDPQTAWEQAVIEVAGPVDAAAFMRFADNVQSSFLNEIESPAMMEALLKFRFQFLQGDRREAVMQLQALFVEMEESAEQLLKGMTNQKLAIECRPWLEKYRHWAKVGQSAVGLVEAGTSGRLTQAAYHLLKLKQWLKRTERLPHKVCGQVMKLFVEAVLQEVRKPT
ncbi:protein O-GlcNAcase [Brevibacillus choshinensis]|uniref:Beta-N-acetylglucosaminidase domain-containing protein n=1 Tax=Brevibacillus choshinensis TaxID=54911 RepID=A0ABX7FWB2_BRECH|nr:protein O-GlcNAcase [Brevibacillus choshinensis]QRG69370.1 beta-N-acetylglucosaminidase domain-containing protein [Brevibacillus choshinensis]